jgi:hypothetical protein
MQASKGRKIDEVIEESGVLVVHSCIWGNILCGNFPLEAIFQLSLQLIKLFFKPALAGAHQPVVNEENQTDKRERTEKKRVTHAPM